MIRGLTGKPIFRASPHDPDQPRKPRKRPEDYLPPRWPPSFTIWQRGRFESQRAAPTVMGPQEEGHFVGMLACSPPPPPPSPFVRPPTPPRDVYTTAFLNMRRRPYSPTPSDREWFERSFVTNVRAAERAAGRTLWGDLVERDNKRREEEKKQREKNRAERRRRWKRRMGGAAVVWMKAKLSRNE